MRRRIALIVTAALTLTLGPAASMASAAEPPRETGWYLSLGDSLAAGNQLGVDHPTEGYVGHVLEAVRVKEPKTRLVNLACSGETTTTMRQGGRCSYEEGSQLAQAVEFLHAHARHTRLVTIDLGGNDIAPCGYTGLEDACVATGLATIRANLPVVLAALRAAAPGVKIVINNYYDPFLVWALTGPAGLALAQKSVVVLGQVNVTIAAAAAPVGADVADVSGAFGTGDWTPVAVPGFGTVPTNLAHILLWTWMAPPRFDLHANDIGYAVMAAAVVAEL